MNHIFFDIETTGIEPAAGHRIISIGAVVYPDDSLVPSTGKDYCWLINPERNVPADAIKINGLTLDDLKGKPTFKEIVDDLLKLFENATIYAHYGEGFDFPFVDYELKNAGKPRLDEVALEFIDTIDIARALFPRQKNSLDALIERAGLSERGIHNALEDAKILAEVYRRLLRDA